MNLKGELHNLKKGVDYVNLYPPKIKVVRGKLLSVGVIINDEKHCILQLRAFLKSTILLGLV